MQAWTTCPTIVSLFCQLLLSNYLAFEQPPGILVHTNFVFVVGEQGHEKSCEKEFQWFTSMSTWK